MLTEGLLCGYKTFIVAWQ